MTGVLKKARENDIGGEPLFSTALIKLEAGWTSWRPNETKQNLFFF